MKKIYVQLKNNAALFISIVALLSSIYFNYNQIITGLRKNKSENFKEINKEIGDIVSQLVEVQKQLATIKVDDGSNLSRQMISLNQYRVDMLLDRFMDLVYKADPNISLSVYSMVGVTLSNVSRFEEAHKLFHKSLKTADNPNERALSATDLSNFFSITNSPYTNKDSADYYKKISIESAKRIKGLYGLDRVGSTYMQYAFIEQKNRNYSEMRILIDSARIYFDSLDSYWGGTGPGTLVLNRLEEKENEIIINEFARLLDGEFDFHFINNKKSNGKLYFYKSDSKTISFLLEIFYTVEGNNILESKYTGVSVNLSADEIKFNMDGLIFNPFNSRLLNTSGSLILERTSKNKDLIYGEMLQLGSASRRFFLSKL